MRWRSVSLSEILNANLSLAPKDYIMDTSINGGTMNIIKLIERDIASVKERIDSENKDGLYEYEFDGEKYETADEVLEAVGEWEQLDCNLSYDAGYVAGLENLKSYLEMEEE